MTTDAITVTGMLAACEERPYRAFTDQQSGEIRPAGSTLFVHLVTGFDEGPTEIKVPANLRHAWLELQSLGQWTEIALTAGLRARGNRIERQYLSHALATVDA